MFFTPFDIELSFILCYIICMIKDLCFEIIQKCPNNCIFCSSSSNYQKSNIIDFATIQKTIDFFMSNGGIKEISLSGGEPLLHPNIIQIIKYCHNLNIFVTLYTSGIIKNKNIYYSDNIYFQKKILDQYNNRKFSEISLKMLQQLKLAGLDKIVFDMQAGEVDEYNLLMGTTNNFANLLKSMLNASKFNFQTSIHFVPNKINISQFKDILEIAELISIDELRILKFVPQGRGKENKFELQLDDEELQKFIKDCQEIKTKHTKLKIGIPLQQLNQHKCTAGFDKIDIRFDGQVLPCPAFKDTSEKLLREKGFKNINIYKNLEDFEFTPTVSRNSPLCEEINKERFF